MTHSRQNRKLAELRAKTDRQLVEYLSTQLDRAMAWAETGESLPRAESIYEELRRLLPVTCADDREWSDLRSRANELADLLGCRQLSAAS